MRIYSPNREERAFLYQEAQDLEPLMKDLGSLSVLVEDVTKSERAPQYRVTFVIAPESIGMKVQAVDGDLFSATIAARDEALRQLNAVVNALPRPLKLETQNVKLPASMLH